MISDDTKRQKDASSPVIWFGNLTRTIRPDDGVDSRLAGFPANLLYSQIADPETDRETAKLLLMMCAFDPAKLLSDRQLCKKVRAVWYYPDPTPGVSIVTCDNAIYQQFAQRAPLKTIRPRVKLTLIS